MSKPMLELANAYDKNGLLKSEIDKAIDSLKDFRLKYPFAENPQSIDSLQQDDIFRLKPDEVGPFFHYLEYYLEPLGHLTIYGSNVYKNIRAQIEDFKDILYIVVDKKKSLDQKVDASWEKIKGLGDDKHIAKKIIFCFNYESGNILPIFSTPHLRYFVNQVGSKPSYGKYYSLGEEYNYLTAKLLKAKDSTSVTRAWEITHFARFLYNNYPPPDRDDYATNTSRDKKPRNVITKEQLELGEFMKLLGELQRRGKISGQQFRDNRELWSRQPQEREALMQRFKAQINQ